MEPLDDEKPTEEDRGSSTCILVEDLASIYRLDSKHLLIISRTPPPVKPEAQDKQATKMGVARAGTQYPACRPWLLRLEKCGGNLEISDPSSPDQASAIPRLESPRCYEYKPRSDD